MQANEDGTRRDLDSEFLHDFRVAVRRTRSCLGQVKGVFDPAATDCFRKEFAWLGRVTGPARDLDVWLLNMREYRREVTGSLRPGLAALEDHLRKQQRTEQRRVARALGSSRYAKLLRDWSAFLERAAPREPSDAPTAERPVREVAVERIGRIFRRVRKRGRGLGPDSAPEVVHRLRIDCKKLRYLLEFFRSLFDEPRVATVVRSLKRLQDVLGEFNDLAVQQRELRITSSEMLERDAASAETLLTMGCLIGRLEQRQAAIKRRLVAGVRSFVGDRTRAAVRELLQ
jgi:CHAD domain-containing protein